MSTNDGTAAGAWSMKQFFKGECGFSRFMNFILVGYILFDDAIVRFLA